MVGMVAEKSVGAGLAAVLPQNAPPWYRQRHLLLLNLNIFFLILFSSANGYDGSMMNGLNALPRWQEFMHHPSGAWLGFINAAQSLGAFVGLLIVPWSNNRFGRKPTLGAGYFWLILGTLLMGAGNGPSTFVLGRFFTGGVSACFGASAPLLIAETSYPTHRGVLTALYNCGWYVGSLIAAWATFGTRNYQNSWSWRIPALLQLVIPIFQLGGYIMCSESPRWLISKGRIEEARQILTDKHAGGDTNSPLVHFEVEEIKESIRLEREVAQTTSIADMWKTKGNRHRLFISITLGVFAQWNGVGVVSYYLSLVLSTAGITSVTDQTLINGCLQIWNLVLAVLACTMVDRLGRRILFLTSTAGMLVSYICITGLSGSFAHSQDKAIGLAVIPFLFIYYGFYDIAFTPLLISYPTEIWTYALRSYGLSSALMSTQLAVFFNIFVNPIALEAIAWKYYIVFAAILLIILVTIFFTYPETRGYSLEEIAKVFDKDEAAVAPIGMTEQERRSSVFAQDHAKKDSIGKGPEFNVTHREEV